MSRTNYDCVNRYSEDEDEMSTVSSFVRCMDIDAMSITSCHIYVCLFLFFALKILFMDHSWRILN